MDFFELQEKAKKNTTRLVFLFGLAVFGLVIGTYFLFYSLLLTAEEEDLSGLVTSWDPELFTLSAVGILGLVAVSSLVKTSKLKAGGFVVAQDLGGTLIQHGTKDFKSQQLLNIVEEMAIASGTPVPPVYVMEQETGINAFAAGYHSGDAVIGVTRGALEAFDRDELQAVIAHEFSHILNGDMKMNINLIGYLAGIFVITIVGRILMRTGFYSGGGSRKGNAAVIGMVGIGLTILGFIGLFFGRLIKAAVSRQREFLADASSVQFTRNPRGIYHALKKIKEHSEGSVIESPKAEEASHMFFSMGIKTSISGIFATHPPLEKRLEVIEKISPSLIHEPKKSTPSKGFFGSGSTVSSGPSGNEGSRKDGSGMEDSPSKEERFFRNAVLAGGMISRGSSPGILASAGMLDEAHIAYAGHILSGIPQEVKESAHEAFGARAVVYSLLMDREDEAIRKKQWFALQRSADPGVFRVMQKISSQIISLPVKFRIPLIEMAIPALGNLTQEQYRTFQSNIRALIEADEHLDIFEWSLRRIVFHYLTEKIEEKKPASDNRQLIHPDYGSAAESILSVLARQTSNQKDIEEAFLVAKGKIGMESWNYQSNAKISDMDDHLILLESLIPEDKKRFLRACESVIASDGEVNEVEAEVFRAIADSLNCPVPPVIPSS